LRRCGRLEKLRWQVAAWLVWVVMVGVSDP
jgi:hypothetical protein